MFGKIIEKISYNLSDEHFSFKSILLILFISAIIIGIIYYIAKIIEDGKRKRNFRSGKAFTNMKPTSGNTTNSFRSIDNINNIVENMMAKGILNIRNFFSDTSTDNHINYNDSNYYNVNNNNNNNINYNNYNNDTYFNNNDLIDEIDYIDNIDSIDYIDEIDEIENINNVSNDDKVNKSGVGFKFNTNRKNTIYHDEENNFFNL